MSSINAPKPLPNFKFVDRFPDDFMMKAFGTLSPTPSQRLEYFGNNWDKWKDNAFKFPPAAPRPAFPRNSRNVMSEETHSEHINRAHILRDLGIYHLWDFQIRGDEIRFREPSFLAEFILAYS